MEVTSRSPKETQKIAQKLASDLQSGDIVALYGELGSGKTVFVQALAAALGVKRPVTSPTFTIIKSYNLGNLTLHHIDLYRLEGVTQISALGLEEIFSDKTIVVIEWADRIKSGLPEKRINVKIGKVNEKTRIINIEKR